METLETLETLEIGGGNTKTPPARAVPAKKWCFTYNNYTKEKMETLETLFIQGGFKYIFGEEIGESGTAHLQGYIESEKKIRPIEYFKTKDVHWEKTKGSKEDNIKYCSKDNKIHTNFKIRRPLIDPLENTELYSFQKEVYRIVQDEKIDTRTIHWFWEPEGKTGKTSLAKSIIMKRPNEGIFVSGKSADIKFAIVEFLKNPENDLKFCFFNFTKSVEDYISYEALESIKDGIFFSGKYESGTLMFNSPHIVCFANFPPVLEKMSLDRWNVYRIEKN